MAGNLRVAQRRVFMALFVEAWVSTPSIQSHPPIEPSHRAHRGLGKWRGDWLRTTAARYSYHSELDILAKGLVWPRIEEWAAKHAWNSCGA